MSLTMTLKKRRQNIVPRLDAGIAGMHKSVAHTDGKLAVRLADVLLLHGKSRNKNETARS